MSTMQNGFLKMCSHDYLKMEKYLTTKPLATVNAITKPATMTPLITALQFTVVETNTVYITCKKNY